MIECEIKNDKLVITAVGRSGEADDLYKLSRDNVKLVDIVKEPFMVVTNLQIQHKGD